MEKKTNYTNIKFNAVYFQILMKVEGMEVQSQKKLNEKLLPAYRDKNTNSAWPLITLLQTLDHNSTFTGWKHC